LNKLSQWVCCFRAPWFFPFLVEFLKMENEVKFEGFKYNISDFYIWFSVCSQKDRNMTKDLYVIFDL